jgi:hypothetical protein
VIMSVSPFITAILSIIMSKYKEVKINKEVK